MPAGRPSEYKEEYADLAYKYCLLGATDADMAKFFDVDESTVNRWKTAHPEFCNSIKEGREQADADIAKSLYHRAKGYSHPDVHVSNYQGEITITPIIKHYPPDTAAAIIWLKNRQPGKWRDKIETQTDINIVIESAEDRQNRLASLLGKNLLEGVKVPYSVSPEESEESGD